MQKRRLRNFASSFEEASKFTGPRHVAYSRTVTTLVGNALQRSCKTTLHDQGLGAVSVRTCTGSGHAHPSRRVCKTCRDFCVFLRLASGDILSHAERESPRRTILKTRRTFVKQPSLPINRLAKATFSTSQPTSSLRLTAQNQPCAGTGIRVSVTDPACRRGSGWRSQARAGGTRGCCGCGNR